MKKSQPFNIFIVDDLPVLVAGLTYLIEREPDLHVLGSALSSDSVPEFRTTPPDLFVIDIYLQSSDGFELVRRLHRDYPEVSILVFSTHDEAFHAERALHSGAKGYLMKSESPEQILKAIRKLLDGQLYVSNRLKNLLFSQLDPTAPARPRNPVQNLTNRELQVITLIGQGKTNKEIAETMSIRLKTVEAHRFRIKEKLKLKHSTGLIQFAIHWVESKGVSYGNNISRHVAVASSPAGNHTSATDTLTIETKPSKNRDMTDSKAPTGKRILIVDDETEALDLFSEALRAEGHTIIAGSDSAEMVDRIEKQELAHIDLLISDVVMPQISGLELASRFRKTYPNAKILLLSGYTEDVVILDKDLSQNLHFLAKPFSMEVLGEKVAELIDN